MYACNMGEYINHVKGKTPDLEPLVSGLLSILLYCTDLQINKQVVLCLLTAYCMFASGIHKMVLQGGHTSLVVWLVLHDCISRHDVCCR